MKNAREHDEIGAQFGAVRKHQAVLREALNGDAALDLDAAIPDEL